LPTINIEKVSQDKVFVGSFKKDGKDIPFYTRKIKVNNGQLAYAKVFKQGYLDDLKPGAHEYTKIYNNNEYTLVTPKKTGGYGGGKNKIPYTKDEYDKLFMYAFSMIVNLCKDNNIDFKHELVSTYIIGAQQAGVKI
jgi:hypothetical protein